MSARRGRLPEIAVEDLEQIVDLALVDRDVLGPRPRRDVGGADQRQIALIGIDEDHPLVVFCSR